MDKFKNKYCIPSTRLQSWNYGAPGLYFITICTKNRKHFFGEIKNHSMILTVLGSIANAEWEKTPLIRPDMNLELGEFVVMPNHFHGVIIIGENNCRDAMHGVSTGDHISIDSDAMHGVSTGDHISIDSDAMHGVSTGDHISIDSDAMYGVPTNYNIGINNEKNKFGMQSKNLGSIIRGFKSSVTTYARKNNIPFEWQERFHDHVIRNHDEYVRISNYIINNPARWKEDKFF